MKNEKEQDKILDHNYDGIQEYDNDLPKWWVWLFVLTVVWGVGYALWFHFTGRPIPTEQLALDMAEIKALAATREAAKPVGDFPSEIQLVAMAKDNTVVTRAAGVFAAKCAMCHGAGGGGLIGPNLTDNRWIHGGSPAQIRTILEQGVLAKGMLAWKGVLSDAEITDMVAFVLSLRGSNPANPKAPEGDFVVE